MKHPITMPALSDTMNNGLLTKWLKKPGDTVKSGEAVAEVETDKAIMEVEAFSDGYLAGPLAAAGKEFPVGQIIGYIAESQAGGHEEVPPPITIPAAVSAGAPIPARAPAPAPQQAGSQVLAASFAGRRSEDPAARPADAFTDDLTKSAAGQTATLPASKMAGASQPPLQPGLEAGPPYRVERASSLREAVARTMIAGVMTPTFRVTVQLPLGPVMKIAKEQQTSLTLLLARACALSVSSHPLFNSAYTPDGLAQRERIDIGIAVDSPEGLITPVLRDTARRPLAELSSDWHMLREKVKSRRLVPADYRGATFYLSDLGTFPLIYAFDSIIPPGASAILSVAAAQPETALATLSCDHRVVFGADAARFLQTLNDWLSKPATLLDDEKIQQEEMP
jgi:pyruvate dehydrogenase E2 component (dihydrolipoamide acetyltransferase)